MDPRSGTGISNNSIYITNSELISTKPGSVSVTSVIIMQNTDYYFEILILFS